MRIGGTVVGGTSQSVLFVDSSGKLAQDPTGFFYNPAFNAISLGSYGDGYLTASFLQTWGGGGGNGVAISANDTFVTDVAGLFGSVGEDPYFTIAGFNSASNTFIYGLHLTQTSTDSTFATDVNVPDEAYGSGWNGSLEVPTKNALYDKIQTIAPSTIALYNDAGTVTYYTPSADTNAARGAALVTAVGAAVAGDTVTIGAGTYQINTTLTPLDGVSIVGVGQPTIVTNAFSDGTPAITLTNDDITIANLNIQSNTTCLGLHSATPTTISNLTIRNVVATVTDTDANALMFSESHSGGNTEHLITANIYNSKFYGATSSGFGSYASLQTGSLMNFYDCDVYGATDGYLHKNSAGTSTGVTNIFGGQAYSLLDAITSGGTGNVINVYGTYAYGDQADLYGDDGTINHYWGHFRPDYAVGNGLNITESQPILGNPIPYQNDGGSLGTTSYKWSDLFLASGSVINWNSGDVTLTHSSNLLTLDGGGFVFNEAGGNFDWRMEGDTDTNLFFLDASADQIAIGTSSPTSKLTVSGKTTVIQPVGAASTSKGLLLSGEGVDTGGTDPLDAGALFVVTYNTTGNRQLALFDSDDIGDNTDTGFRYILGYDIPMIDGISGTAATRRNINLGFTDNNVGFGFNVTTAVQADIAAKVDIRGSGTTTGRGLRVSDSGGNENFSILDNATTVFNETGKDADFRIEGDTNANLFYVDAGTDRIGVNTSSPSAKTHVIATTEQQRLGYDTSNYVSSTVSSAGAVTYNAVGASSAFIFSDPLSVSSGAITATSGNFVAANGYLVFNTTDQGVTSDTVDGTDNQKVIVQAAGNSSTYFLGTRSAALELNGNEAASAGAWTLYSGTTASVNVFRAMGTSSWSYRDSSNNNNLSIASTGTVTMPPLSASTPLKLNSSKEIISADIDLTTDVTGVLPLANGGTGASLSALTSNTWTPTLTNVSNVASSTAYAGRWIQVGSVVTGSIGIEVDPTSATTSTEVGFSLPVASNFTLFHQFIGTVTTTTIGYTGAAVADTTNDRGRLLFTSDASAASTTFLISFSYTVL